MNEVKTRKIGEAELVKEKAKYNGCTLYEYVVKETVVKPTKANQHPKIIQKFQDENEARRVHQGNKEEIVGVVRKNNGNLQVYVKEKK